MYLSGANNYDLSIIDPSNVARGSNEKNRVWYADCVNAQQRKHETIFFWKYAKTQNGKKSTNILKFTLTCVRLHVLWVVSDAVNQLIGLDLKSADFVDGSEEWELVFHVLGLKHVVDFFGGDGTLKQESQGNVSMKENWQKLPATFDRSTFPSQDRRCSFQFSRKLHCTYGYVHLWLTTF